MQTSQFDSRRSQAVTECDQKCCCTDPKPCAAVGPIRRQGWTPASSYSVLVYLRPFDRTSQGKKKEKKRKNHEKKCFANSHKPHREFLDIKAGVMTVKVASLLTQGLSRTHTFKSRCVHLPDCVRVVLCIPAPSGGFYFFLCGGFYDLKSE